MKKKFILTLMALCVATCAFGMGACKDEGESSSSDSGTPSVPSLEFTDSRIDIVLGESKQISMLSLADGETVTYTSNDETIATVSQDGVVEGKKIGSAVIKATTSLGRSALAQVTVYDPEFYPVPYIAVTQETLFKTVGDSFTIDYSYTYLGQPMSGKVDVTTDNSAVVAVEGDTLRAVGVGSANIQLSATSSYGTAMKTIQITVTEKQVEFYPSFLGKDLFVGNAISLTMYVNVNGNVSTIDNASFSVKDADLATIEDGKLIPLTGGDTEIVSTFEYAGVSYEKEIPVHIYGYNTCSFVLADGTVDHTQQMFYGDNVTLALENPLQNPEYNKEIKCWYINGEEVIGDSFVMPDEDVEVSVRFINETKENFEDKFSKGHLLGDAQAKAKYVEEPFVDSKGVSSDGGYVRYGDNNWASLCYNFDAPIVVNEYASVQLKVYMPTESMLLYFGYASSDNWSASNPTKRYEASAGTHRTGDVPLCIIPENEWTIIEMPLSAFVDSIGDKLNGISISVAKGAIYIDHIIVNQGLAVNDPIYMDNLLTQKIVLSANGSQQQTEAIMTYYTWTKSLTDTQRATATHQANVAAIKEVFAYYDGGQIVGETFNAPTVTGGAYQGDRGEGDQYSHPEYASHRYQHIYMTQINAAPHDATFTLKAFNYNAYGEVYFGLFMISDAIAWAPTRVDANVVVTINGQNYTYNTANGQQHWFKVTVKNGVLTLTDDSEANIDGGATVLTVALSDSVLNGEEGLVMSFNFEAWGQVENTSICTSLKAADII